MNNDDISVNTHPDGYIYVHRCVYKGELIVYTSPYRALNDKDYAFVRFLHEKGLTNG